MCVTEKPASKTSKHYQRQLGLSASIFSTDVYDGQTSSSNPFHYMFTTDRFQKQRKALEGQFGRLTEEADVKSFIPASIPRISHVDFQIQVQSRLCEI